MTNYRRNHYVPEWYQYRFLSETQREQKFFYLDLKPEIKIMNGHQYKRNDVLRWGPPKCFYQTDLYTTKFLNFESTEIEQKFFGEIDFRGRDAVEYFSAFEHPNVNPSAFRDILRYMSVQKLRTPKGLAYLSALIESNSKNELLFKLQELQKMFCALWTECIWQIADASSSSVKLIISDHPITVYNKGCFPASKWCADFNDPGTWLTGTHTLFPLSQNKILILTNLSWMRNPYGNPIKTRPNPQLFRQSVFNFLGIQTHRFLSEEEVIKINFITKLRAYRYVAAQKREWLYPEKFLKTKMWNTFGDSYLLMPDPRSVIFSSELVIGYGNKRADVFDAHGRQPWHKDFKDKEKDEKEWETFHAFKGEYARKFGPRRLGRCYEFGKLSNEEDSLEYHDYHLSLELKHKKYRFNKK